MELILGKCWSWKYIAYEIVLLTEYRLLWKCAFLEVSSSKKRYVGYGRMLV